VSTPAPPRRPPPEAPPGGAAAPAPLHTARYGTLLAALCGILVVLPVLADARGGLLVTAGAFTLLHLAGVWAVVEPGRLRALLVSLALAAVGGDALLQLVAWPVLVVATRLASTAFLGLLAATILGRVLREERVTTDTILGGIDVYLLLGFVFYGAFALLEFLHPGSFASGGAPLGGTDGTRALARGPTLLYYSFVTLTTLGYGDVVPAVPLARSLAVLEALVGQLYLAILVASLVGLHLAQRGRAR
jgi:hypothetical protein